MQSEGDLRLGHEGARRLLAKRISQSGEEQHRGRWVESGIVIIPFCLLAY